MKYAILWISADGVDIMSGPLHLFLLSFLVALVFSF